LRGRWSWSKPTGIVEPHAHPGRDLRPAQLGEGRIYVILENEIAAIAENGDPVPGWPLLAPASFAGWLGLWPAPDGGLVVSVGQARYRQLPGPDLPSRTEQHDSPVDATPHFVSRFAENE